MDRRQKKTRSAIFKAFIGLLAEKKYNQISVQEIIDGADVGRTTFYAHFETKDYLLKELCEELFDHIIDAAMGHSAQHGQYADCAASDSVFLHLLYHLQKNDNHILELLSSSNNDIFQRYFKSNLKKLILMQYADSVSPEMAHLPADYLTNHIAAVFAETVDWWISKGMKESPDVINGYFLTVIAPILGGIGEA